VTGSTTYASDEVRAHRAVWIRALRSGLYEQAQTVLRQEFRPNVFGYCCLGVAEEKSGCTWRPETSGGSTIFAAVHADESMKLTTILTDDGMQWLGLRVNDPQVPYLTSDNWSTEYLSVLNDSGVDDDDVPWTLEQIANVVEPLPLDWDGTETWCREYVKQRRLETP
jgi:hypothetical protein